MAEGKKTPKRVDGTNCYNCSWLTDKEKATDPKELNGVGGIDPKNKDEMDRAKTADLITLPGGSDAEAKTKRYCDHSAIRMFVTVRMCCGYWDNEGVKRPWK